MAETHTPDLNDLAHFVVSGAGGDFVFREGEVGAECFIIQEGQIELVRTIGGRPRRLAVLGSGDFFGESALFDEHPRDVSAHALTEFRLLRIDRATFDQIIREDSRVATRMVRRLASYLREQRTAFVEAAPVAATFPAPTPARRDACERPAIPGGASTARATGEPVLADPGSELSFPLADKDEQTVGRIDRARRSAPDIDLAPLDTDQSLSRRHATILRRSGHFYIREAPRVPNGTFVNGTRLEAGQEVELVDGTQVCFGLVETLFTYRDLSSGRG